MVEQLRAWCERDEEEDKAREDEKKWGGYRWSGLGLPPCDPSELPWARLPGPRLPAPVPAPAPAQEEVEDEEEAEEAGGAVAAG